MHSDFYAFGYELSLFGVSGGSVFIIDVLESPDCVPWHSLCVASSWHFQSKDPCVSALRTFLTLFLLNLYSLWLSLLSHPGNSVSQVLDFTEGFYLFILLFSNFCLLFLMSGIFPWLCILSHTHIISFVLIIIFYFQEVFIIFCFFFIAYSSSLLKGHFMVFFLGLCFICFSVF